MVDNKSDESADGEISHAIFTFAVKEGAALKERVSHDKPTQDDEEAPDELPTFNNTDFAERLGVQMRIFLRDGAGTFDLVNFLKCLPIRLNTPESEFTRETLPIMLTGNVLEQEVESNGEITKITWQNGIVYEGPIVSGKLQGEAKQTWPDGTVFYGEFNNNKISG